MSNSGPLSGLRVVDFGQYIAGPMVGMFLADFGADVIHVDPPGGVSWKHPANVALQRGKRIIELDLKSPADLNVARRLIETADIVVEGFRPGTMERLGLGYETFRQSNQRLIWLALPGFASDDSRSSLPAWEGVVCAAAGLYASGEFHVDGEPWFSAIPLASNFAAFAGSHRVLGAVLQRLGTGRGQHIEFSLYEACFEAIGCSGEVPVSRSVISPLMARLTPFMEARKAADGNYLYFDAPLRGLQAFLDRFLPQYTLIELGDNDLKLMADDLSRLIATRPAIEWERIGQEELNCAIGIVQSSEQWLSDPHARASGTVVVRDDPEFGHTSQPGVPVVLSGSPGSAGSRAAVLDGRQIDWAGPPFHVEPWPLKRSGLPLEGITVFDCATLLAGPTTTRVLAQHGAHVIKVEKASLAAGAYNMLKDDPNAMVGHRTVNAGKRMMFLDLTLPAGREIAHQIAKKVDVVHHNFTAGTAERLGMGASQIRALNPGVIFSTLSLHSVGGSRSAYRGHEELAQMITGIASRLGGSSGPHLSAILLNDHGAGHLSAFGIMMALLHRHRTGEGQQVNGSLSRTATLHQTPFMVGHAGRKWDEPRGLGSLGWHALDRLYRGQDGWFYLATPPGRPGARVALAAVAGLDGVTSVDDDRLEQWLSERFAARPVDSTAAALSEAGFACHRYRDIVDACTDEQAVRRGHAVVLEHPEIGCAFGVGLPALAGSDAAPRFLAARRPGMDTIDVLEENGFGDRTVKLLRDGVIALGEYPVVTRTTEVGYWTMPNRIEVLASEGRIDRTVQHVLGGPSHEAL